MADAIMIINAGLALISEALAASASKYIAWGTGTTGPAAANTALETASAEARTTGTQTQETTTTTDDTYQCVGTITCTGSGKAITEVGIFDASTAGDMYLRGTFSAINVGVGDSINFTIKTVYARVA